MLTMITHDDNYWMQQALSLAKQGALANEVPVGAIVVLDNKVIGKGFNQPISLSDPSAHAEIIAMREAAKFIKNYRLVDATLYVTLEPCPMCAGAMIQGRIKHLVYGASDPKSGAVSTVTNLFDYNWNHKISFTGEVLSKPCGEILRDFFKARRK